MQYLHGVVVPILYKGIVNAAGVGLVVSLLPRVPTLPEHFLQTQDLPVNVHAIVWYLIDLGSIVWMFAATVKARRMMNEGTTQNLGWMNNRALWLDYEHAIAGSTSQSNYNKQVTRVCGQLMTQSKSVEWCPMALKLKKVIINFIHQSSWPIQLQGNPFNGELLEEMTDMTRSWMYVDECLVVPQVHTQRPPQEASSSSWAPPIQPVLPSPSTPQQ